jgi:8-oxo-dGTP pyrophosphatase MutT (NUDIX family)
VCPSSRRLGPESLTSLRALLSIDDGTVPHGDLRAAAVLVPLFVREDTVHVVLTKRTDTVRTHQGQVSFPGGSWEEEDASLEETALREAEEEVGLSPDVVKVIGVLDDLPTYVSGFLVRPFVAEIPHPYRFVHDSAEVAHVFAPPLEVFADPSRRQTDVRERDGVAYTLYSYEVDGEVVWGATARMLTDLVTRLNP